MSMIRPRAGQNAGPSRSGELALPAERLLAEVLNSSHDGIMVFESVRDHRGSIIDFSWLVVNPAAEEIVGCSAEELIGQRLLSKAPGHTDTGIFDSYVAVVETGQPHTAEHHYAHDGINGWFLTTAVRLDDGFAVTFRDVTEQRQL